MLQLDRYTTLADTSRVPDVGTDLIAIKASGNLDSSAGDRLLAVLELWRHQEITREQAISFSGLTEIEFSRIISSLV
jgi:hypothetical protein